MRPLTDLPLDTIRTAHYDRLNTDLFDEENTAFENADNPTPGDGEDLAVPVFDRVPDEEDSDPLDQILPFVVLGRQSWTDDHTKTAGGWSGGLRIHVWSLYQGGKEVTDVAKRVTESLARDDLIIPGWDWMLFGFEDVNEGSLIEQGVQVREAVLNPAAQIHQA